MGDGARIESTDFIDAVGIGYVARPGLAEGRDRIAYGVMIGANFNVFVDDHNSFRLILAGTMAREEPLDRDAVKHTAYGGAVELHFGPIGSSLFFGFGVNPRFVTVSGFRPPEFELGVMGRMTATIGNFGLSLNVGGSLRPADIERSGIEASLGAFLNLF